MLLHMNVESRACFIFGNCDLGKTHIKKVVSGYRPHALDLWEDTNKKKVFFFSGQTTKSVGSVISMDILVL